eukprot:10862535-Alexandrium_andersonii.AAC.1
MFIGSRRPHVEHPNDAVAEQQVLNSPPVQGTVTFRSVQTCVSGHETMPLRLKGQLSAEWLEH